MKSYGTQDVKALQQIFFDPVKPARPFAEEIPASFAFPPAANSLLAMTPGG